MTLKLLPPAKEDTSTPLLRIDTDPEARRLATTLSGAATRVQGILGKHWTTEPAIEQAKIDLLLIAEEALALHRVLSK